MTMFWDDVAVGPRVELGSYLFTQDDIIRFARKYDPQPFHVDPASAARTPFGGIIASGWHTTAIWMKLATAHRVKVSDGETDAMISPGFEDLRWLKPVRPGMTLHYSTEVTGKRALASRADRGLIITTNEARDDDGALVMRFTGKVFAPRRQHGE
jgi:acyl dehydratase